MFGSLRKKLEEITAQVNPFDGGKTASTVRASRQQAPPAQTINRPNQSFANKVFDQVSSNTQADQYRRQQQQRLVQDSTRGTDEAMRNLQKQALTGQVDKNVAAAKIRALGTSNVQPNTAENVLKPTTPAQIAGQKVVDTTMNRKVAPVALGVGRSVAGTVRGVSGIYDLASPGDGVNRVSKVAVKAGDTTDRVVKENNYNQIAYKGAQAGGDLATFAIGGAAGKALPGVSKGLSYADRLAKPVSNVVGKGATSLASKGFAGRVAGKSLQNITKPGYQAANAGFTALQAGKEASHGTKVTPMGVTTNLVAGGVAFPVAGAVVGQTAKPVINAGVNQIRKTNLIRPSKLNPNEVADLARLNDTAKTGAVMDEGVYQRGVQAAQKAGVDYNNPSAVDDLLGKHRTFDTVHSQRKQAIEEAKTRLATPKPLNEIGAVGKNVDPDVPTSSKASSKAAQQSQKLERNLVPDQTRTSDLLSNKVNNTPFVKDLQDAGVAPKTSKTPEKTKSSVDKQLQATQKATNSKLNQQPNSSLAQDISPQGVGASSKVETPQAGLSPSLAGTPSQKTRKFITTVMEDPNTSPKVKESISSLYTVRNTKELQAKAATLVNEHPDVAEQLANTASDDTSVAVAQELIKKLQKEGNYTHAINLVESLANDLTKAGQTVQAASIYGKLTPEGILRFTQKEINTYNKATGKNIKLDPGKADKLTQLAKKIESMPEGDAKKTEIAKLVAEVQTSMPSTVAQKMATLQTMAQLLNPKTNIRNIGGNTIFSGLENISQTVATPIDSLLSLVTGKRTTTLPSLKTQATAGVKGGKKAVKEAYQGINTGPNTQFELNDVPVFRKGILSGLEKTMNATLRGADRAAYEAAFDDSIRGALKANKTKQITPEMIEQAHQTGLYRTFQDNNNVSGFFIGMKRALNKVGIGTEGKRFGLGDIVLKYPKTPGNLLARGIDYSPAGFLKATYQVMKAIPPGKEFNQKAFVDEFSRAVVGSGSAFGIGYVLADNGIITAKPEQNKDLRNLQKTEGLGGYQVNASAFKRWVLTGFNKDAGKLRSGDTLVSYDWAQPIAIPISAGAALGTDKPRKAGQDAGNAYLNSVNTLAEQPLLQGLQNLFGSNQTPGEAAVNTAKSAPASFVPTALNQVNQLMDNNPKNTLDPNPVNESLNLVKAKIPGLAQTLPNQVDVLGQDKQRYQNDTNNPFNVFLNPAFVNKYTPNPTASTGLDLYRQTGETKQLPNTVGKTIKVNGQTVKLNGQQQSDLQKYTGTVNTQATEMLAKNPRFQSLPDNQKINIMSSIQTDINSAARIKLFQDEKDKVSESVQSIIDENVQRSIELKLINQEKANKPKVAKDKKSKKAKVAKAKKGKSGKKGGKSKGKKGKFDYTKNLFASTGSATSGSVSKSLRAILENAQKSSSKK